jgi:hypothetical protein
MALSVCFLPDLPFPPTASVPRRMCLLLCDPSKKSVILLHIDALPGVAAIAVPRAVQREGPRRSAWRRRSSGGVWRTSGWRRWGPGWLLSGRPTEGRSRGLEGSGRWWAPESGQGRRSRQRPASTASTGHLRLAFVEGAGGEAAGQFEDVRLPTLNCLCLYLPPSRLSGK